MSSFSPSLVGLFLVGLVAVLAPILIYITRTNSLPAVVLEILGGIIIGPQVLNLVHVDVLLRLLSSMGLSYLLFLAGLEVDLERLRGRLILVVGSSFLLSLGLALLIGLGLGAMALISSPLFIANILVATSLGIVIPILKDAGQSTSDFGQLVIAGATLGEFGSIILLSLFFSSEVTSPVAKVAMLGIFALLILLVSLAVFDVRRTTWFTAIVHRLQDTTAQINVRIALTLLVGFVVLANGFGAEAILGAFLAGVALRVVYRDPVELHEIRPLLRVKLEAIGFGFFVPIFFITIGLNFDLHVFANVTTIILVPLFLEALLLVRGVPAVLYRQRLSSRHTVIAGCLQATSLTFIVAATQIGEQLGLITTATVKPLLLLVSCRSSSTHLSR
jgi:Kef-type K+ transport system membrane component KefB